MKYPRSTNSKAETPPNSHNPSPSYGRIHGQLRHIEQDHSNQTRTERETPARVPLCVSNS